VQPLSGTNLYVSNEIPHGGGWASTINVYPATSDGNVAPSAVIGGSLTHLSHINGLVVNASGELYVANSDSNDVVGFAAGASGNVSPNVVIAGSNTRIEWPVGLGLDSGRNLYVGVCGSTCGAGSAGPSVLEFAAGSNGNVAPIRDITGSLTQLVDANDPKIDPKGNIYVSNWRSSTIDVFKARAKGNAVPIRVISGSNTKLDAPDGIAVNAKWLYAGSAGSDSLLRFHRTASGNVAPVAVIAGKKTGLGDVDGIALDHTGNLYAASPGNAGIFEFTPLAGGNVRPFRKIQGSNTQLVEPVWVFVR
jgi:sugar lactone lactonase YvrE